MRAKADTSSDPPMTMLLPPSTPPSPASERSRLDPLLGTTLGPYSLERRIGEGGLGRVYLGVQGDIGLRVAIKVLGTEDGPPPAGFIERFQKEAQALARVSHPNVVRILGYSPGPPFPYLVMEMVEDAQPLSHWLNGGTSPALAMHLLRQLLFALEAVHAAQVVHRDLKPSNILVQSVPGEAHLLRLVDFGLAKFLEGGRATRLAGGTPAYMAPEQMGGLPVGPATDLYSVGILAAELFSGRRVFGRMPESDIMRLKRDREFLPRQLIADAPLPPALCALIDQVTASAPEGRPADAPTLRALLEAAVAGMDPTAPPSAREGTSPPARNVTSRPSRTRSAEQRLPTLDPGPPEPTSAGSRPIMGAIESATSPEVVGPGGGRALWLWGAALGAAVLVLGYLTLTVDDDTGRPEKTLETTLRPPRLLGENDVPLTRVEARPMVEAVTVVVPAARVTAPDRAIPPARAIPVRAAAPAARPRTAPKSTTVSAGIASLLPAPATVGPASAATTSVSPGFNAALGRVRTALARCDCVEARGLLATVPQPPAQFRAAVGACQPPMLGERCAPGALP